MLRECTKFKVFLKVYIWSKETLFFLQLCAISSVNKISTKSKTHYSNQNFNLKKKSMKILQNLSELNKELNDGNKKFLEIIKYNYFKLIISDFYGKN